MVCGWRNHKGFYALGDAEERDAHFATLMRIRGDCLSCHGAHATGVRPVELMTSSASPTQERPAHIVAEGLPLRLGQHTTILPMDAV